MGWKEALGYIKGAGVAEANARQDMNLPLGGRIGGMLQLQKTPFIQALSQGSLIDMPTDAESFIKAISRVDLPLAGKVYRYYLATGDAGGKELYLQIYVNAQGAIEDLVYCSQLTRIVPETEADQQVFMGLSGYGLGDKNYCIWREQLAELGFAESDLRTVFGAEEALEYWRDAGSPEQEFIPPFQGSETRLDDAQGITGVRQELYYMPYKRVLGDGVEYLFITTEIVQSQDGDSHKREMHVDFMIGIPVAPERISIL